MSNKFLIDTTPKALELQLQAYFFECNDKNSAF